MFYGLWASKGVVRGLQKISSEDRLGSWANWGINDMRQNRRGTMEYVACLEHDTDRGHIIEIYVGVKLKILSRKYM